MIHNTVNVYITIICTNSSQNNITLQRIFSGNLVRARQNSHSFLQKINNPKMIIICRSSVSCAVVFPSCCLSLLLATHFFHIYTRIIYVLFVHRLDGSISSNSIIIVCHCCFGSLIARNQNVRPTTFYDDLYILARIEPNWSAARIRSKNCLFDIFFSFSQCSIVCTATAVKILGA